MKIILYLPTMDKSYQTKSENKEINSLTVGCRDKIKFEKHKLVLNPPRLATCITNIGENLKGYTLLQFKIMNTIQTVSELKL